MIEVTLNALQARALFDQESVFFGNADRITDQANAVPAYRIGEIFGNAVLRWLYDGIGYNGTLKGGKDYNAIGSCSVDDPLTFFVYLPGFMAIVSQHNKVVTQRKHAQSEYGKYWDSLEQARREQIAAIDAENDRKSQAAKKRAKAGTHTAV